MAGMFYSRKEAAEKLAMSENELDSLVKSGKMREFRHGETLMYKVDEIDLYAAEMRIEPSELKIGDTGIAEGLEESGLLKEAPPPPEELKIDEDIPKLDETPITPKELSEEDEILLAPEDGKGDEAQLSEADTTLVEDGVKILGETDLDADLDKDTSKKSGIEGLEETSVAATDRSSLEEVEKDVNLDTFGSGSGLLDLSLQADDTSLGGILDEIYTQDEGKGAAPAAGTAEEAAAGSAMEVAAEADEIIAHDAAIEPSPVMAPSMAMAAHVEAPADSTDKFFWMIMLLGLAATIVAIITATCGSMQISTFFAQNMAIYAVGGVFGLAFLLGIVGLASGAEKKPKAPKPPKAPKAPKPPKVKKEKPPKKPKGK